MTEHCTLCLSPETKLFATVAQRSFFVCPVCDLKFAAKTSRPTTQAEEKRYKLHQNDVNDTKYQKFVSPLVSAVRELSPLPAAGLDYGCGPGPVTTHLLRQAGYEMKLYDPFFRPDPCVLENQYDFVVCSEAAEHFFEPKNDFHRMRNVLRPNGKLFLMTLLWNETINFETWHYQRDITHVSFYSTKTIGWLKQNLGFAQVKTLNDRVIVFQ